MLAPAAAPPEPTAVVENKKGSADSLEEPVRLFRTAPVAPRPGVDVVDHHPEQEGVRAGLDERQHFPLAAAEPKKQPRPARVRPWGL